MAQEDDARREGAPTKVSKARLTPQPEELGTLAPLTASRRSVLGASATVAAFAVAPAIGEDEANAQSASVPVVEPGLTTAIAFEINKRAVEIVADVRASLLDLLRERLGLTGAKKGCDHGQCGACTVHLDDRRVASCLTLAAKVDGRRVTTIEGITPSEGGLHPMQRAFVDHDALQCGYCTPGQIMAAIACVNEGNATSPERIREYMSGNICRCGAYVGIVAAIRDAAPKMLET